MASCASCGTEGVAGEQFCRNCGARTDAGTNGRTDGWNATTDGPTPADGGRRGRGHVSQFGPLANLGPPRTWAS